MCLASGTTSTISKPRLCKLHQIKRFDVIQFHLRSELTGAHKISHVSHTIASCYLNTQIISEN